MATSLDGYYAIGELAEALGVSENAIHMYRKRHGITGRRVGRCVFLRLDDLDDFKISLGAAMTIVKEGRLSE